MTNTKFRKRALLSSVAMLIVALIALSSATFAWFAANTTVNTTGLAMKTTASTGLVVRSESAAAASAPFGKTTQLDVTAYDASAGTYTAHASRQINPASFDATMAGDPAAFAATLTSGALTFGDYVANSSDASAKKDTATWGAKTVAGYTSTSGDVYAEKIFVRTSDGAAADAVASIKTATVTISLAADADNADVIKNCVRVALVAHQGAIASQSIAASDTFLGVWAPATSEDDAGNAPADAGYAFKAGSAAVTCDKAYVSGAPLADGNYLTVTNSSDANYITAYVYLDGYDYQCASDNVTDLDDILTGVDIQFDKV